MTSNKVAVFHHIGDKPSEDKMTHTIEQILAFDGQITFDGAYTSVWRYSDVLGPLKPIMFVQGDTLGQDGVCLPWELRHLRKAGFILGWHGNSHRRLTELSDEEVVLELTIPEKLKIYLKDLELYAYPHGDWDERTAKLVKEMGYLRAYSTTQGEEGNDFAIPRYYL